MALTIYKYQFKVDDDVVIEMPHAAKVLHVDVQGNVPTLWALVDPGKRVYSYHFLMRGTGHPVPEDVGSHIGSFFDGPFVWHMFHRWADRP